jgi:hypothetical protein
MRLAIGAAHGGRSLVIKPAVYDEMVRPDIFNYNNPPETPAQNRASETAMQLESTLTCPECHHRVVETMPTDACQFFYDCKGCGARLKPKHGDCCVFCSYGDVPCPPVQHGADGSCCR